MHRILRDPSPAFIVQGDLAAGRLVEVPGPGRARTRDVYAVLSRSARKISRVRLFLDLLRVVV
ncbi:MAG: hypothetical protein AAGA56_14900 [Myxococcota bacterium]